MKYDIFISYKRKGASSATAAYLYELLQQKGYNVFFDRKEMRSGKFNEQLLEHISNATDIIILLDEESLGSWFNNRSREEPYKADGFFKEVMHVLSIQGKNNCFEGNFGIRAEIQEDEPYKTDWFCKEVMHALSIQGKNIVPVLLNGYAMPEGKDLPPEMAELSLHNALSLDTSEIEEFYEKLEQGYLKSKPTNLSMTKRFQSKGGIVGCFLFYTDVDSCDLYECGEKITTLTDSEDEWHPFRYPVNFAGEHRFKLVNNDSCEVVTIKSTVETNCQQYVQVQFSETRNLWELTKEEIDAQCDKDTLYNWGVGLYKGTSKHDPNIPLSFECLSRSINLGNQCAMDFINNNYPGFVQDKIIQYKVAFKWYKIAADNGNAVAQNNLGYMYETGQGVEQNYAKAIEYYTKAAEQGHADAQNNLGCIYGKGQSVKQNYAKAIEYYTKAAEQGNAYAQINLGYVYETGQGVEQNYAKAMEYYTKAAEQGNADAQNNLGVMYENGKGAEQDYAKAVGFYTKAADQGNAYAQYNLGLMYHNGQGVEQDYAKAVEFYTKSSDQGYADAQHNLGFMYQNGQGVEKDYGKAVELYAKAAENGCTLAYNGVAWTYHLMGEYEKALPWAEKAINAMPDVAYVVDTLATVYEDLGRLDDALKQFGRCLYLYKEDGNSDGETETIEKMAALKEKMKK